MLFAVLATSLTPRDAAAQTRADSAAVLLHAADELRLRGETGAARALLELIERQYAGTPASGDVARMRALLRRTPDAERSGRTELMVFGATYGAWLGVALPLALESESPTAYGVGLLVGAPAGFLAARSYANRYSPTEGQTRALTFGGLWGTAQGFGWAEVLDIGREEICDDVGTDTFCYETDVDAGTVVASGVIGGLVGIGTGAWLARKPIPAGTAAAVTLSGFWGTWFGWGLGYLADRQDDGLLATSLLGGNAALLATGYIAPKWEMSESRARLISVGGVIGLLGGAGLMLILQPDDDEVVTTMMLASSAAGLAAGAVYTRPERVLAPEDGGEGALLQWRDGRWGLDAPDASLRLQRTRNGLQPTAYIPLLHARF